MDNHNKPSEKAQLRLFQVESKHDFLVVYDEYSERRDAIKPRAYFLLQNQKRIENLKKPSFVGTNLISHAAPVPLFAPPPPTNAVSFPLYAVAASSNSFTIYSGTTEVVTGNLPVYDDGSGRLTRLLLTPATVTADATIVGGCLGLIFLCNGGRSTLSH